MSFPEPDDSDALVALRRMSLALELAHSLSTAIALTLSDARAARANELCEKLADAAQHAQRLATVIEGDLRYDAALCTHGRMADA